jgi:hypothetical protein
MRSERPRAATDSFWPVVAGGAATLAGVALQGVIGGFRERRADVERWRTRWDENKLETCIGFLLHLGQCAYDISTWADLQRGASNLAADDPVVVARLESYRQSAADLRRIMQQLRLVMSDGVFQHAVDHEQGSL